MFCLIPGLQPRFYVGHSIYKGKAALTVEPRAPEFVPLDVSFIQSFAFFFLFHVTLVFL